MIVETDLELVKDACTSENVESDSETFRESNGGSNFPYINFYRNLVEIHRNKTSVSHNDHLLFALLPLNTYVSSFFCIYNAEGCTRVDINPKDIIKNSYGE